MRVRVGTSGYSYKEWRGSFYPEKLAADRMLAFYAERFGTVEINNTFYRMPVPSVVERWGEQVPDGFQFVIKASRRITHEGRLKEVDQAVGRLIEVASTLGPKLGPLLFQLPPNFKKDAARLRDFLAAVPAARRPALEFRHPSWFDDETYEVLHSAGAALCAADTDEADAAPVVPTTSWGYLRLRRPDYDDAALAAWVERVHAQPWEEAFVFFKHEDEGLGPRFATRFLELWG